MPSAKLVSLALYLNHGGAVGRVNMRAILGVFCKLPLGVIHPNTVEFVHPFFGQYTNSAYQPADRSCSVGAPGETEEMYRVTRVVVMGEEPVSFPNMFVKSIPGPTF